MNTSNHKTETTPRIYVASLADYNAGQLLGRWIDADQPAAAIHEQITRMLGESTELVAEEWAIHDYENFGSLHLSEFEDIETVSEVARLIQQHGPMFAGLVEYFGGTSGLMRRVRRWKRTITVNSTVSKTTPRNLWRTVTAMP